MPIRGVFAAVAFVATVSATAIPVQAEAAAITGRVVDERNRPVAGTLVALTVNKAAVASTRTASDGSYSVSAEPGTYSMTFVPPTKAYGALNAFAVTVPRTAPLVVQLTAPMKGRARLTGAVALSSGEALARDTTVYFANRQGSIDASGRAILTPSAGSTGLLTIKGATNGNFSFRMFGSTNFTVNQDTFVNFVVPVQSQRVRVVTLDGQVVANALIEAGQGSWGSSPAAMAPIEGLGSFTGTWNFKTMTDAQGWASIPFMTMATPSAAGYRVTPPKGSPYLVEQFQRVTGTGDITLTLTQRVSMLAGSIRDQNGNAHSNVTVFYGSASATTDSSGAFAKAVPSGIRGNFEMYYSIGSERTAGFRYTITPFGIPARVLDTSKYHNLVVGLDQVTVKVTDASGLPVANARVLLTDKDGYAKRGTIQLVEGIRAHQATFESNGFTNSQGLVTLTTLRLDKELSGVITVTPPSNSLYAQLSQRAPVGAGAAVSVALPRPTVVVSGKVTTSSNVALLKSNITFTDSQRNEGTSSIALDGSYSMRVPMGTRGTWFVGCDTEIVRDLTTPLCVRFSMGSQTISAATSRNFVIPTYSELIRVVDKSGKAIPNVAIKVSAGHDVQQCFPTATISSGFSKTQMLVMASSTTNADGVASVPMVKFDTPCKAMIGLIPDADSRFEDKETLLEVGAEGTENVIVLTIEQPVITSVTVTETTANKTLAIRGENLLGAFRLVVGGTEVTTYKVVSDSLVTTTIPTSMAVESVTIENGGGISEFKPTQ